MCAAWQLSVWAIGLTCFDHFHPGLNVPRPTGPASRLTISTCPIPSSKGRVSSGNRDSYGSCLPCCLPKYRPSLREYVRQRRGALGRGSSEPPWRSGTPVRYRGKHTRSADLPLVDAHQRRGCSDMAVDGRAKVIDRRPGFEVDRPVQRVERELVMVRTMSRRRAWTPITVLAESVPSVSDPGMALGRKVPAARIDSPGRPVDEGATGRVGILTRERELDHAARHPAPVQLGRSVLTVAGLLRRNLAAVFEVGAREIHVPFAVALVLPRLCYPRGAPVTLPSNWMSRPRASGVRS